MQLSLLDALEQREPQQSAGEPGAPSFDPAFSALERTYLDEQSWVDHLAGWVSPHAATHLFDALLGTADWRQRSRWMYEKRVIEPRLTTYWLREHGSPLQPPLVEQLRETLSARYGVDFDSVGFNLYRDGQDSVAWHGDRISREIAEPVVALVSLGEARRFLLRPKGGGPSRRFALGAGDLLVTGGRTQRTWEHSVPKVARAGARISLAFRHGMSSGAYGQPSSG